MENNFILIISGILICQQMAKGTTTCRISGNDAYCSGARLTQVPMLPHSVSYADLSQNYINEVNEESFIGLEGLQMLDMGSQYVSRLHIKGNAFNRLSNLTYLHLGGNINLHIEPDAFEGLANLEALVLLRCGLKSSILSGIYLRPLISLERLQLFGNVIERVQPAPFFRNMSRLDTLDLSLNRVSKICQADLINFQGKHFRQLNLKSNRFRDMTSKWFNWEECGNPFKNMSIEVLDLSSNGFQVDVVSSFFKAISGTEIQHLILSSSTIGKSFGFDNLKDPNRETFQGLKDCAVKILDLSKCYIFALGSSLFSSMLELELITLAQNKVNKIERNAFLGMGNLQILNLSYNLIGEIYSETFQNLPNLQVLDLSFNHIGALSSESFSGLSNLLGLDLTGNSLRNVHTLAALPNVQVLRLNDNKISSWYGLPNSVNNSRVLTLESNKFSNFEVFYTILETFHNIEQLHLGDNFFLWCSERPSVPSSTTLQFLYLQRTAVHNVWEKGTCLNMFDNLSQLLYLFLNENSMQSLPNNIFKGLTSLVFLDLSFNSLTYLPHGIFPRSLTVVNLANNLLGSPDPHLFSTLSVINLKGNLFFCDCNLKDFQAWINQTNVTFFTPVEELVCEFPPEQKGVSLMAFSTELCEEDNEELLEKMRFLLFIMSTVLVTHITGITIVFVRLRGYCFKLYKKVTVRIMEGSRKSPPSDELLYDIYLCFSASDFKWVERALMRRLDSQFSEKNAFHCCLEARDFMPGEDHLSNMHNAIRCSRKTVCVVSKEFLTDGWCLEAFAMAQSRMLEELCELLIVIVVGNIPCFRLRKYEPLRRYMRNREFLQWPEDSQDLEWFYDKLTKMILKDTKFKQKKNKFSSKEVESALQMADLSKHKTPTTV